jgi:hypothetical protein
MISKDKTYRTRDGREVRIYATDAGSDKNIIHGASNDGKYGWVPHAWLPNGEHASYIGHSLIEVKPRIKRTVWLNVYPDKSGDYSQLRNLADALATTDRIACVKVEIDCEHGEGL